MVENKPVRVLFMSRRGFNEFPLKNSKIFHKNELEDFIYVID